MTHTSGFIQEIPGPHGSDVCDCGDYRSQHDGGVGACLVFACKREHELCRLPRCQQFKLARKANEKEWIHWAMYHAERKESA